MTCGGERMAAMVEQNGLCQYEYTIASSHASSYVRTHGMIFLQMEPSVLYFVPYTLCSAVLQMSRCAALGNNPRDVYSVKGVGSLKWLAGRSKALIACACITF